MGNRWTDAHAHVSALPDPAQAVAEAMKAGVSRIAANSEELESMKRTLSIAEQFPAVQPFLGIHPSVAAKSGEKELIPSWDFLEKNRNRMKGVGETGLDYRDASTKAQRQQQKAWFEKHLDFAQSNRLPASVHSRGARTPVLQSIEELGARRILLHWFYGNEKEWMKAIELDCFLSVGPSVLDQPHAQSFAKKVPLDRLLLETDCPVSFNGKPSSPQWIPAVAKKVAELRNIPFESLGKALEKNASGWLGL